MKLLNAATMAGLMLGASIGVAQATPMTGTFTIDILQGTGNGNANAPIEQAAINNPLLSGPALAVIQYTGALDFNLGGGATNTIGAFLASGGGTITQIFGSSTYSSNILSTSPFALTTLFEISGFETSAVSGTITHDDGASLYQNNKQIFSSPQPTAAIPAPFSVNPGAFTLFYVEANGLPAVLDVEVPEPASLALLGFGLAGLGLIRRNRASGRG